MSHQASPPTPQAALARLGPVRQLGYVVEDLNAAVAAWQHQLGIGPWTILSGITLQCAFEGQASQPRIDIALAYRGEMQIELIQQHNDAPSPYLQHREHRQFGLHHTAFLSSDIDADVAALQAAGLTLACDIRMPMSGRYVYFRSPVAGEHSYIEVLEATAMMRQMFASGMARAQDWQGPAEPLHLSLAWPLKLAMGVERLLRRQSTSHGPKQSIG